MKLIRQFIEFIGISGVGWLLDFLLYIILSMFLKWEVFFLNCMSSFPSVTLVFFVSTRKVFQNSRVKIPLNRKYLIYIIYQVLLLLLVSSIGQRLSIGIGQTALLGAKAAEFSKIIVKLMIAPITMIINFFTIKFLIEKI